MCDEAFNTVLKQLSQVSYFILGWGAVKFIAQFVLIGYTVIMSTDGSLYVPWMPGCNHYHHA